MASNAIQMTVIGNIYIGTKVIEVKEHYMLIFHCPFRRRSTGPLLSCLVEQMCKSCNIRRHHVRKISWPGT